MDNKSKGVPFHKACIAELQAAFKVGLKVNSGEESDLCPAVRMGYSPEVIKFLIDSGCDVNEKSDDRRAGHRWQHTTSLSC